MGGLGRGFGGSLGGLLVEVLGLEGMGMGCSYLSWEVLGFPLSFVPSSSLPPVADFCSTADLACPEPGSRWFGSFRRIPGKVGLGKTPAPMCAGGGAGGLYLFYFPRSGPQTCLHSSTPQLGSEGALYSLRVFYACVGRTCCYRSSFLWHWDIIWDGDGDRS